VVLRRIRRSWFRTQASDPKLLRLKMVSKKAQSNLMRFKHLPCTFDALAPSVFSLQTLILLATDRPIARARFPRAEVFYAELVGD
jgi:hypothetical protein